MTSNSNQLQRRPTYVVFYDASCELCRRSRQLLERLKGRVSLQFVDSSHPSNLREWPQIDPVMAKESVLVLDPAGRLTSGFAAVVTVAAAESPVFATIAPILLRPPFSTVGDAVYRWISGHRHAISRHLTRTSG